MTPTITFRAVVLDALDARALAQFYRRLLGWELVQDEPDWAQLAEPGGDEHAGPRLSFQTEPGHVPPAWPAEPGDQRMQLHLDFQVDDLDAAVAHALACGARRAPHQPQDGVRVLLDPAGHPFCLFLPGS